MLKIGSKCYLNLSKKTAGKSTKWIICFSLLLKVFFSKNYRQTHEMDYMLFVNVIKSIF